MNAPLRKTFVSFAASLTLLGALSAAPALADPTNGDFENGGTDWTESAPPGFLTSFPLLGGNPDGHGRIESGTSNPGGQACISQTFECGVVGGGTECTIGFDYQLTPGDAAPGSGRIVMRIDGLSDVVTDVPNPGWEFVAYVVPCGTHTLDLCLDVDPQNNQWTATFDNVRSACTGPVSNEGPSWSTLKSRFHE